MLKDWELDDNGIVVNAGGDGLRVISMDQSYCNANHNPGQAKTLYVLESGPESGLPDGKGEETHFKNLRMKMRAPVGGRIVLSGAILEPIKEQVGNVKYPHHSTARIAGVANLSTQIRQRRLGRMGRCRICRRISGSSQRRYSV